MPAEGSPATTSEAGPAVAAPRRTAAVRRPVLTGSLTRTTGLGVTFALLVLCAMTSLAYGSVEMSWGTAISAFTGYDGSDAHIIVRELRVPRTLIGIMVGAALALAGALMQGVTRNPLADPSILGIEAGASLAVVVGIAYLGATGISTYIWLAFLGAAIAAVVVYTLGSAGRDGATPIKLALAGTVLAELLISLTYAILVGDMQTLDEFRFWSVGSLTGRDMGVVREVAPFLAVGVVIALASGRSLNALSMGEDMARSLGQRVALTRAVAAFAVVLLAGASVAAAGPIAFVGLAVPHAVRLVVGTDWRWVLAYCALVGPIFLLSADIIGRVIMRPGEVEVGIVTALVGAPVFVALARRKRLAEL